MKKATAQKGKVQPIGPKSKKVSTVSASMNHFAMATFQLKGLTPMLQRKPTAETIDYIKGIANGTPDFKNKVVPGTKEELVFKKSHVINWEDQRFGYPAAGIGKALKAAIGLFPKKEKAITKSIATSTIFVQPTEGCADLVEFEYKSIQINERSGIADNMGKKRLIWLQEPQFNDWKMELTVEYNSRLVNFDDIVNLLLHAGKCIGFGAFRPERGGVFGQFTL